MSRYRSWEHSHDYLFILDKDNYITDKDLENTFYLFGDGVLNIDYSDDCIFNNEEIRMVDSLRQKICYAYACYYNDEEIDSVLYQIIPGLKSIDKPYARSSNSGNLREWMEKYGFDLKEFFLNRKYIVFSDSNNGTEFDKLATAGLINWDKFEHFDVFDYEDKNPIKEKD